MEYPGYLSTRHRAVRQLRRGSSSNQEGRDTPTTPPAVIHRGLERGQIVVEAPDRNRARYLDHGAHESVRRARNRTELH
jgi:hypothetical protein